MFKKIKVSLTQPPLAVFFMKDKWTQVLKYLFFVPLFLLLPLLLSYIVSTDFSVSRTEALANQLSSQFRIEDAYIESGQLFIEGKTMETRFDYFTISLSKPESLWSTISIVFEESDMVLYSSTQELRRMSYVELDLADHDFNDQSNIVVRSLAFSIKTLIDQEPMTVVMDVVYVYLSSLFNYVTMVLLISLLMMLFMMRIQLPFSYRFKISVYLTTVWVFVELIFMLFGLRNLDFLSTLIVYMYHIWAFRSVQAIPKGVI